MTIAAARYRRFLHQNNRTRIQRFGGDDPGCPDGLAARP